MEFIKIHFNFIIMVIVLFIPPSVSPQDTWSLNWFHASLRCVSPRPTSSPPAPPTPPPTSPSISAPAAAHSPRLVSCCVYCLLPPPGIVVAAADVFVFYLALFRVFLLRFSAFVVAVAVGGINDKPGTLVWRIATQTTTTNLVLCALAE